MSTRAHEVSAPQRGWLHPGSIGMLTASWALAGGLAAALFVVALVVTDRMHPDGLILIAALMAALGSIFGTIHGAVLGYLGRPASGVGGGSRGKWAITALAAVAAFGIAIITALWLAISAVTARAGNPLAWMLLAASVVVSLGIAVWATVLGWRALENAYARWPDHRLGTGLVLGAFAVLMIALLAVRPAIPGTGLPVSPLGAILVAALATLWIALPVIIITLPFTHRRSL